MKNTFPIYLENKITPSKKDFIPNLRSMIEVDLLTKATFISKYENPDWAYQKGELIVSLKKHKFGILILFSSYRELEKIYEEYQKQYNDLPLSIYNNNDAYQNMINFYILSNCQKIPIIKHVRLT